MEYPNPKIKFYKVRTLSEKLTTAFDFLRENWKPLLQFSFYLILPICLFQAFSMNAYMRFAFASGIASASGGLSDVVYSFVWNFCILMILLMVGSSVLYSMVYSLMAEYERRDSRLMAIRIADIRKPLIRNVGKMLQASLFLFGVSIFIGGIIVLFALVMTETLFLTLPLLVIGCVVVWIPLNLFTPIYLYEDIPFFEALNKSFLYGYSAWGETFVIVLVLGLIGNIVSSVTMTPWYLVLMFGEIFSLSEPDSAINASVWYQFITYLLGIVQSYGMYVSYMLGAVGIAFQYFHIREKKEGISFSASIQNFDRL